MLNIDLTDPREVACAWSSLIEPGNNSAGSLIEELGAAPALEWLLHSGMPQDLPARIRYDHNGIAKPWKKEVERWIPRLQQTDVARELACIERLGGELWYPGHPRWPSQLDDLGVSAPVALWARGNLSLTDGKTNIALVGARASTNLGDSIATEMAYQLAADGYTVVSGGAFGIDAAVHKGAIQAAQQTLGDTVATVAFMAGGVGQLYPVSHTELFNRLLDVGLVLSEVPPLWRPAKWRFLARNRLIAAYSQATVVVEAGFRSGALSSAHRALELGREVGAVPGPATSQMSIGCHQLIRNGATLVSNVKEVKELVTGLTQLELPLVETETDAFANPFEERVWQALPKQGKATVESVAAVAGLSVPEVDTALFGLVATGKAQVFGGYCWRINQRG